MRKIALLLLLLPLSLVAQLPQLEWVSSTDGPDNCLSRGTHLGMNGAVFSVGSFFGEVDFDPSSGVALLTGINETGFLQSLNENGQFQWVKGFGFQSGSELSCIAVETDADANIYVAGDFFGSADLDPGEGEELVVSEDGDRNGFIAKLNSDGDYLWSRVFYSDQDCNVYDIHVTPSGSFYVVGEFQGIIDLDPGEGTDEHTSQDFTDGFVVELNSEGEFINSIVFPNQLACRVECVEADDGGNLYLSGSFSNTVDFDPSESIFELTSAGGSDVFVLKINVDGELEWARNFGGETTDNVKDLVVDGLGNVITTGYFRETADFDPGESNFDVVAAGVSGQPDGFVHKLDSQGNFAWVYAYGGVSFDEGNGLAVDVFNDIYMNGRYAATADFLPGDEVLEYESPGFTDGFILGLSGNDGSLKYVSVLAATDGGRMGELDIDHTGALVASGRFGGMADFDPDPDNESGTTSISTADHFNWKLNQCILDTVIFLDEGTFIAAEIPEATYQWFTCDDPAVAIDGATNPSFTPEEDGFYFVEISLDNCTVPSECLELNSLDVEEQNLATSINMFPNPASQVIHFRGYQIETAELYDMTGKRILTSVLNDVDISALKAGIYLVRVQYSGQVAMKRLVVTR